MRGDLLTQPGRRHLSLTPLSFWVAMGMRQSFLQRLFQVFNGRQTSTFSPSDVSKFALQHSGEDACGIPDKDTIVLTGGQAHNFVTRWEDIPNPETYSCVSTSLELQVQRLWLYGGAPPTAGE